MRGRVTAGLALLRTTGLGALVLLLWNPTTARFAAGERATPPLVLLDASLRGAGGAGGAAASSGASDRRCGRTTHCPRETA